MLAIYRRKIMSKIEFSEAIISVLGVVPDAAIAKRTGIPVKQIKRKRQELNIPPEK